MLCIRAVDDRRPAFWISKCHGAPANMLLYATRRLERGGTIDHLKLSENLCHC